jgi:hypothetical protein
MGDLAGAASGRLGAWASPRTRGMVATIIVLGSSAGFAVLVLEATVGPPLTIPARHVADRVAVLALVVGSLAAYGGLLAGGVAMAVWTHRCYRNLPWLGSRPHLPPILAAASWLVPLVNLVVPWLALQDLAAGSGVFSRERLPIYLWWALWLGSFAVWVATSFVQSHWLGSATLLHEALLVVAGALLAVVVMTITRRQDARAPAP